MYWKRPYFELIFVRENEHLSLHAKNRVRSDETRAKMSASHKGMIVSKSMLGKKHSADTKQKMSASNKGLHKGMHWKVIYGKRVWY